MSCAIRQNTLRYFAKPANSFHSRFPSKQTGSPIVVSLCKIFVSNSSPQHISLHLKILIRLQTIKFPKL